MTTPTPTSGAADLLTLIEAYAEARHRQGHSSYNAQTSAALQAVKAALAAGQATATQPAPVLWLSPEQFANFMDTDEAPFGKYVPARKTSAGKFTMPLFAVRAPAPEQPAEQANEDSVLEDAARYRFIRDVPYSDDVRSVLVHQQNAAMDRVIDAARKQGEKQ